MKKIFMYMCVISMFLPLTTFASGICDSNHGTLTCGSGTINDISYTGFVDADGTTVSNSVDVWGDVSIANSHLNIIKVTGESRLKKTDIAGSLKLMGRVNANDVQINNSAKITGDIYAKIAIFNGVTNIIGLIECEHCVFKTNVDVVGDIKTEYSEFLSDLTLDTSKATFINTKLNDIIVKQPHDYDSQTIYLKNNSKAHNISFASQKGIVMLSDTSQITGLVQGGKIVKN